MDSFIFHVSNDGVYDMQKSCFEMNSHEMSLTMLWENLKFSANIMMMGWKSLIQALFATPPRAIWTSCSIHKMYVIMYKY